MANQTYNDISEWKILPVSSLNVWINGEYHEFKNIAEGTYFRVRPVLRNDDSGRKRPVALSFEGSFSIVENNLEDMLPTLEAMNSNNAEYIILNLEALPGQANGESLVISIYTPGVSLNIWSANWQVDYEDNNILLTIEIKGYCSFDALSAVIPLFKQYW